MTTEEKARRYDEAIEIAKEINNEQRAQPHNVMTRVFPELKEDEGDRIRKELLEFCKDGSCGVRSTKFTCNHFQRWVTWLEKQDKENPLKDTLGDVFDDLKLGIDPSPKQGEQKAVEPTDFRTWKYIIDAVLTEREGIGQYIDSPWTTDVAEKLQKRFGTIESKPVEWSEEDKEFLEDVLTLLEGNRSNHTYGEVKKWLKSLHPLKQWKPTVEQINALQNAISFSTYNHSPEWHETLKNLLTQLKALL